MTGGRALSSGVRIALCLAAVGVFVGIVACRGGPALDDAYGVVRPTTALSHGDLTAAARAEVLPQPPGYAMAAAPVVAALRPLVGAPGWCDRQVPSALRSYVAACRGRPTPWYRSQALLAIGAWMVLAAGCIRLLRVAGVGGGWSEVFLVVVLAVMPAASDGVVETFHPQDLVCVGLIAAALSEALRRRWMLTGVLFGAAFACKQFALLPLLAVVAAAPGWRERGRILVPAVAVVVCVVAPFYVADPSATIRTLGAVDANGITSLSGGTLLGKSALSISGKLLVARDGPVVAAGALCLWARWRCGRFLLAPVPLVGLVVACLATRLVAEVWFASYYLLAVSALSVCLDLVTRRFPWRSLAWIAVTAALVESGGGNPTSDTAAVLSMAAAAAAVAIGLEVLPVTVSGRRRATPATSTPG